MQIVLASGAGETNTATAIVKRMGLTGINVGKWRKRYLDLGQEGLHGELKSGQPRTYQDDQVAEVINGLYRPSPPMAAPTGAPAHSLSPQASLRAEFTAGCRPLLSTNTNVRTR